MTARLTLICHGETAATRAVAFPAGTEPLSPRGRAAATAVGPPRGRAGVVVTSPAAAAVETAVLLGLRATSEAALRERETGAWAGLALAEVGVRDPGTLAAWLADPEAAAPGGETVPDVVRRVGAWLGTLDPAGGTARVVAVTHAAVIRAALCAVLHLPPAAAACVDVAPLGRVVLSRSGAVWRLQRLDVLARRQADGDR